MNDNVDNDQDETSFVYKNCLLTHQSQDIKCFNKFFQGIVEEMPDDFDTLFNNKPDWIDPEKLKRGQQFAMNNYFCVSFAEVLSLFMIFAYSQSGLDTLIYTRKSDTPYRAYRRYYKTTVIVKSWFETDILTSGTQGYDNLRKVFRMHRKIKEELSQQSGDEIKSKCAISGKTWCPSLTDLQKDFKSVSGTPIETLQPIKKRKTIFNQCYLAMTQFGFFGLAVVYPEWFGIHNFTKQEMHDFVHLWRTIGYFMGIKDEYNFGRGTLDEVVERSRWIIRVTMKPKLREVTDKWEHMSRCLIEGIKMYTKGCIPFNISLCYLCDILGLDMINFKKSIGYRKRLRIWWLRLIMKYLFRYDCFKYWVNKRVINNLNKADTEINDENVQIELKNKLFTFENVN